MQKKEKIETKAFSFIPVKAAHRDLIHSWLIEPHVTPFFYGQGLQNTYRDLERFIKGEKSVHKHWLAYYENIPFAYLMNSEVTREDEPYGKWIKGEVGMTLDLLIGDRDFLGKGLATHLIKSFLEQKAGSYLDVFIDPSLSNSRAIHVYEKVGFKRLEHFIAPWDQQDECLLLKLDWSKV